jgi:hypothetical protein
MAPALGTAHLIAAFEEEQKVSYYAFHTFIYHSLMYLFNKAG